jgi:predicted dehydrogenase
MKHTVGIIGLGMIGEKVLAEFLNHPAFTVTAAWDLSQEVCKHVKASQPAAPIVSSAEQVLNARETELIYIGTPPATHVEYGLKVIELGKALFLEKPLSLSLTDSQRLVESAEKHKISTAMNFGYGSGPVVVALQDALDRKLLGRILSIEVRYQYPSWPLPNQLSAASWITSRKTGGMLREMFSHHVYLIHRILGPLSVTTAEFSYPPEKDATETFAIARLQTGGIPVWFMGGLGSPHTPRDSDFTINGELGALRITEGQQLLMARNGTWVDYPIDSVPTAMQARLNQLAELLEGKACKLPTIRDGFEVQKVIDTLVDRIKEK